MQLLLDAEYKNTKTTVTINKIPMNRIALDTFDGSSFIIFLT
jgi:hypothetical protein